MADRQRDFVRWVLMDGDRHVVAGTIVLCTFVVLVGFGAVGVIGVENHAAVRAVAGGFVPGLIAFLSIVLAINQLVLSQELGSAGEIRGRIEEVREYRHDVEALAGERPSPVLPTGFLSFVVETIEAEAHALAESVGEETDPATRERVRAYARRVADEANRTRRSLDRVRPGRINALLPVLTYDDSRQLLAARRLQTTEADLPPEAQQALSDLVEALELFSVARTQFRTTYTQRVLARLSRQLLYVGLPALVVVILLGLLRPSLLVAASPSVRLVLVSGLFAIAFAPLAVLAAYLLRVATVSERTISVGPFVSRPKSADLEHRSAADPDRLSGTEDGPLDDDGPLGDADPDAREVSDRDAAEE